MNKNIYKSHIRELTQFISVYKVVRVISECALREIEFNKQSENLSKKFEGVIL